MGLHTRKLAESHNRIGLILLLCCLAFFGFGVLVPAFKVVGVILLIVSLTVFTFGDKWRKGAEGEEQTIRSLEKLDEHFQIIHDITLPGGYGNIDHIVIGETGIFIIETKNYSGEIVCNGDTWRRHYDAGIGFTSFGNITLKPDRDYEIGSPSKQVKGQAMSLRDFLKEREPSLSLPWINGVVVFTDPNTKLRLHNPTVPVLTINQVETFIRSQRKHPILTPETIKKIAGVIGIYSTIPTVRWKGGL